MSLPRSTRLQGLRCVVSGRAAASPSRRFTRVRRADPKTLIRPQSRPTSSNDAFEGQVDFVARQIDRYFGIFATRVSVIPMAPD